MALIIGSTGFIGQNIMENLSDVEVLDRNLYKLKSSLRTDTLFISAPSANKWLVNSNPRKDLEIIFELASSINKHIKAERIIVFSTIDVYKKLSNSTEQSITLNDVSYGGNRRTFEELLSKNESKLYIFRLSGLFGKHLKKNIIYDLCNKRYSEVSKYNLKSEFQFTEISSVIKTCLKLGYGAPGAYNLTSPPIQVSDLLKLFDWTSDISPTPYKLPLIKYNVKTIHKGNSEYMFTSEEIYVKLDYFRETYAN
jgi:nucleoside-diphosphate-sugar epimerase